MADDAGATRKRCFFDEILGVLIFPSLCREIWHSAEQCSEQHLQVASKAFVFLLHLNEDEVEDHLVRDVCKLAVHMRRQSPVHSPVGSVGLLENGWKPHTKQREEVIIFTTAYTHYRNKNGEHCHTFDNLHVKGGLNSESEFRAAVRC